MVHFAFVKEMFYGIGDFFKWSFQFLTPIGFYADWILTCVGFGLLVYWCLRIVMAGDKDVRSVDHRLPHNKHF